MSSAAELPPGTILAEKFRVVRRLGEGGMGAVYEIEHLFTKHRRALKLLHAEARQIPGIVERFLREASAAGRIDNPHIVETFDAGTLDTGEPYVVMEMLSGRTLADLMERQQRLGLGALVDLIGQACEGVQAAHDAGIVHRDLKPENLFVTERDGASFVKLLDFGISKFDPSLTGSLRMTTEGSALGTPYYMPPEQVRGELSLDARADVYALGVILYECAAGEPPFTAASLPHLILLIHQGQPTPLATLRPDLPAEFHELVASAMAVNRDDRFQTARALGQALRALPPATGEMPADELALHATMAVSAMTAPAISGVSVRVSGLPAPPSTVTQGSRASLAAGFASTYVEPMIAKAPPGRRLGPAIAVGAVLAAVAAGGVVFAVTRPHGSSAPAPQATQLPATVPTVVASAPAPSAAPPVVVVAPAPVEPSPVAPTASALPAASPAAPAAVRSATAAGRHAPGVATVATAVPATAATSRAEKGNLATDNPFK